MGLFSKDKDAIAEYENAQRDLERVSQRDGAETADYRRANDRVAEAEKNVGWLRR